MRRISLPIILLLGFLLLPNVAAAVSWIPIVPCGGTGQDSCTPCHIFETFKNLIDLVLYGITGPIAAFMIVWAGGMMVLGGGKPSLFLDGKKLLTNTLTGVAIILLAWVLTNFLVKSLIRGGQGDNWYEFSCPAGLALITPLETALPTPGAQPALPAATLLTPKNIGVAAVGGVGSSTAGGGGSTFSKCNKGMPCPGTCPNMQDVLNSKGGANKKLLEAIMFNESSCLVKPRPSGAGAYGLMQLQPATANMNRQGCDVTQPDEQGNPVEVAIDAAWLQDERNKEKIVCVANNFVNSLKSACGTDPLNLAAGYNGGPGACQESRDCAELDSCTGSGTMRRWECPWDNRSHTLPNRGYVETRKYAPKVAACAR